MKKQFITASCLIALASGASAVTLNLSAGGPSAAVKSVIQDNSGAAVSGLVWGLLVDVANDGFATDFLDNSLAGTTLASGSFGGDTLILSPNASQSVFGIDGSVTQIQFNLDGNIDGQTARLVWFDGVDSTTLEIGQESFVGLSTVETTITTNNADTSSVTDFYGNNGSASFILTQVPEPSAALLGLIGLAGLLRRRR